MLARESAEPVESAEPPMQAARHTPAQQPPMQAQQLPMQAARHTNRTHTAELEPDYYYYYYYYYH